MVSNPNTFSEAGTSSLGQITDGQDFPHTGLLKSLSAGVAGNYVISGFNITPTGNGSTTGTVGNGVIFQNGEKKDITLSPNTFDLAGAGTATSGNCYSLLVIQANGTLALRTPASNANDKVADISAGDAVIAVLTRVGNGSTAFQMQYLTYFKTDNSLSIGRNDSGYTESLKISSVNTGGAQAEGHVEIEATEADKDIIFKVKDGNTVGAEVMRINASEKRVGIGTDSPDANLHVLTTGNASDLTLTANNIHGVNGLLIESTATHTASDSGPMIVFYRNGSNAPTAGGSTMANILFVGEDTSNNATIYGQWKTWVIKSTNGDESYGMAIQGLVNGANKGFINCLGAIDDGSVATDYGGLLGAEVAINQNAADIDFRVESTNQPSMLFVDAGNDRVGIGTNTPSATLEVATGGAFRSPRLSTVSVSASTTLTEATHAGAYLICAGNVTLPATSTAGEHYTILNTTGGNITVGRNNNNINGAGSDATVSTFNAVTCIAIGSNNWIALGV